MARELVDGGLVVRGVEGEWGWRRVGFSVVGLDSSEKWTGLTSVLSCPVSLQWLSPSSSESLCSALLRHFPLFFRSDCHLSGDNRTLKRCGRCCHTEPSFLLFLGTPSTVILCLCSHTPCACVCPQ